MNSFSIKKDIYNYIFILILLLTAGFCSFYNLQKTSLANWDEGLYANIVAEMNGAPKLIAISNDQPWLEKPILGFWLHLTGTNLFGLNNFGLRFMGSLLFIGSALLLYLILQKFYSIYTSFFVSLAFTICPIFFFAHMIRSADFESYFIFFTILSFWLYIVSWKKPKLFFLVGLTLGLSFMIRGYISLLIFAAIYFHLLLYQKYKIYSLQIITYSLIAFLLVILPWHIYAIISYPKEFFNSYLNYHFLQRIIRPLEGHKGDYWFYLDFLYYQLGIFALWLLIGFNYFVWKLYKKNNHIDGLWLIWILSFIIPLQIMGTKIVWYIIALTPACFLFIASIVDGLTKLKSKKIKIIAIFFLIITGLSYYNYSLKIIFGHIFFPPALPLDSLTNYIHQHKITPKTIITFSSQDSFGGPAANFQWNKLKTCELIKIEDKSNLNIYLKKSDNSIIILTDLEGYKIIKLADYLNNWDGEVLNYFQDDWLDEGVPIIMRSRLHSLRM